MVVLTRRVSEGFVIGSIDEGTVTITIESISQDDVRFSIESTTVVAVVAPPSAPQTTDSRQ